MTRILVLNGPNMGRLGRRPREHYGADTLEQLTMKVSDRAQTESGVEVEQFQSNSEGDLIDHLYSRVDEIDAVVINPAGLTFYGDSLYQALLESGLPLAVVHLSNIFARSDIAQAPWRQHDLFARIARYYLAGLGADGYHTAIRLLARDVRDETQISNRRSVLTDKE